MKNYYYLLLSTILVFSGCASAGMNTSCAHVDGNEVTIPYVGGKANGNIYVCHMGCFGFSCPKADYTALATMTSEYIKSTGNGLTITVPATVTVTPSK